MWFKRRSRVNPESEAALRESSKRLREARDRGKEVTDIADALRQIRERNHFAEQLEDIIMRRRGQPQ